MRYFTTTVPTQATVEFSWGDFLAVRTASEIPYQLKAYSRLISGYVLLDGLAKGDGRIGDWDEENATKIAFFIAHQSRFAVYQEWTEVRAWFRNQQPAVQRSLLRVRIWFQTAARTERTRPWNAIPHGMAIWADLSTGAVIVATHVDHSDC